MSVNNPSDPLLYLETCILSMLPGGTHEHLAPPYHWDALLDISGSAADKWFQKPSLPGSRHASARDGKSSTGALRLDPVHTASPTTPDPTRAKSSSRAKKSRAVSRKFNGQYRRYQPVAPTPTAPGTAFKGFLSSKKRNNIPQDDDWSPVTGRDTVETEFTFTIEDGIAEMDGVDNENLMNVTLAKSDCDPENLHDLFAAFAAGLLVRRPAEPLMFILQCLGSDNVAVAAAEAANGAAPFQTLLPSNPMLPGIPANRTSAPLPTSALLPATGTLTARKTAQKLPADPVLTRPPSRSLFGTYQNKAGKLAITQFVPSSMVQILGDLEKIPAPPEITTRNTAPTAAAAGERSSFADIAAAVAPPSRTLTSRAPLIPPTTPHFAAAGQPTTLPAELTPFPVVLTESMPAATATAAVLKKDAASLARVRESVKTTGQVSVFLSSPFKGIEEERSLFARRELPRLQRKCEARGVHLRILDLRWGISNQQKEAQELLHVCLSEIDRADFFIGFHAMRYGTTYDPKKERTSWVLDNVKKCAKQFPWLWNVLDRSLTEMEYLHGWLNDPGKKPAAFFFRDDAYDTEQLEKADESEKWMWGGVQSPLHTSKMIALKEACRKTAKTHEYAHPGHFVELLGRQMDEWLDQVLPTDADLRGIHADAAPHIAALRSNCVTYIWSEQDDQLQQLLASNIVVVVEGASGSGKSSMSSNAIQFYSKAHPSALVFVHFTGSSAVDSDVLEVILRRFIEGVSVAVVQGTPVPGQPSSNAPPPLRQTDGDFDFSVFGASAPDSPERARVDVMPWDPEFVGFGHFEYEDFAAMLPIVLESACAQVYPEQIVVYLDSIDKCHDLRSFEWLPTELPTNFRIILSCKTEVAGVLRERRVNGTHYVFTVPRPLSNKTRKQLCIQTLANAGKTLGESELHMFLLGRGAALQKGRITHASLQAGKLLKQTSNVSASERNINQVQVKAAAIPTTVGIVANDPAVNVDATDCGSPGEIFIVMNAPDVNVGGRYRQHPTTISDSCHVYTYEDNGSYRLLRVDGVWCLQHTTSRVNMYICARGTDTPPTHGWIATDFGESPAPTVAVMVPPTSNPLFLHLALEVLVAVDKYHQVNDTINAISSCGSVPTLLQLIFDRLETTHAEKTVGIVLSQIAFSRGGMMESELCKIAGVPGNEEGFAWAFIFNAVAPLLRNQGGCFSTLHSEVRDAVRARYVSCPGLKWAAASIQFAYFRRITDMRTQTNTFKTKSFRTRQKIVERAIFELEDMARFYDAEVVVGARTSVGRYDATYSKRHHRNSKVKKLNASTSEFVMNTRINLSNNRAVGMGGCLDLFTAAIRHPACALTTLILDNNTFGPADAAAIAEALRDNSVLEVLSIAQNHIGNEGADAFANVLKESAKTCSIRHLNLRANNITTAGTKSFAQLLQIPGTSLQELIFTANTIGVQGASTLAKRIGRSSLKLLLLSRCGIGSLGAKVITRNLAGSRLVELDLSSNAVGDVAARTLARSIGLMSDLKKLNLRSCELTEEGGSAVANAISTCISLTDLSLGDNAIGDRGAIAFSTSLTSKLSQVVSLDLSENMIGPVGGVALGQSLAKSTVLHDFNLGFNSIGNGADAFGESLKVNTSLTKLDLKANQIENVGALPEMLLTNGVLADLNLSLNNIGGDSLIDLEFALRGNTTLTTLNLHGCQQKGASSNSKSFLLMYQYAEINGRDDLNAAAKQRHKMACLSSIEEFAVVHTWNDFLKNSPNETSTTSSPQSTQSDSVKRDFMRTWKRRSKSSLRGAGISMRSNGSRVSGSTGSVDGGRGSTGGGIASPVAIEPNDGLPVKLSKGDRDVFSLSRPGSAESAFDFMENGGGSIPGSIKEGH